MCKHSLPCASRPPSRRHLVDLVDDGLAGADVGLHHGGVGGARQRGLQHHAGARLGDLQGGVQGGQSGRETEGVVAQGWRRMRGVQVRAWAAAARQQQEDDSASPSTDRDGLAAVQGSQGLAVGQAGGGGGDVGDDVVRQDLAQGGRRRKERGIAAQPAVGAGSCCGQRQGRTQAAPPPGLPRPLTARSVGRFSGARACWAVWPRAASSDCVQCEGAGVVEGGQMLGGCCGAVQACRGGQLPRQGTGSSGAIV